MNNSMRKVLFFVVLIGMAYVSWEFMIKKANINLTHTRDQIAQKKAKLSELHRATQSAQDLSEQLEKIEEAIIVFESKLPPESEIDNILTDITVIAQKHGLTSKTIRTLKTRENSGYIEQPLEMVLTGNFNSYYAFLLEVEKLDRITKIRELMLKKQTNSEGQTEAKFIISIFFQNSQTTT
jgi:type IV pilus assembly protein PilO